MIGLRFDLNEGIFTCCRQGQSKVERLLWAAQRRNPLPSTRREDQFNEQLEVALVQLIQKVTNYRHHLITHSLGTSMFVRLDTSNPPQEVRRAVRLSDGFLERS